MPDRAPAPPSPEISRIYRATLMDFEMIAHAREAIQRSFRILDESRQLAAYPGRAAGGRPQSSIDEHYASDAMEAPGPRNSH